VITIPYKGGNYHDARHLLIIKGKDKAGRYIENRIMLGIRRFIRGGASDHEEETSEQLEAIRLPHSTPSGMRVRSGRFTEFTGP
jgi:hypothetical protein